MSYRTGAGEPSGETPGVWVGTGDTENLVPVQYSLARTARVDWEELSLLRK